MSIAVTIPLPRPSAPAGTPARPDRVAWYRPVPALAPAHPHTPARRLQGRRADDPVQSRTSAAASENRNFLRHQMTSISKSVTTQTAACRNSG